MIRSKYAVDMFDPIVEGTLAYMDWERSRNRVGSGHQGLADDIASYSSLLFKNLFQQEYNLKDG